jgi:hypothetical protein
LLGDLNALNDKQLRTYLLKQIFSMPTGDERILEKMYTNIADWYSLPIIIPDKGKRSFVS